MANLRLSNGTLSVNITGAGNVTIRVTATDPRGLSVTDAFNVTVIQPNRSPKKSR